LGGNTLLTSNSHDSAHERRGQPSNASLPCFQHTPRIEPFPTKIEPFAFMLSSIQPIRLLFNQVLRLQKLRFEANHLQTSSTGQFAMETSLQYSSSVLWMSLTTPSDSSLSSSSHYPEQVGGGEYSKLLSGGLEYQRWLQCIRTLCDSTQETRSQPLGTRCRFRDRRNGPEPVSLRGNRSLQMVDRIRHSHEMIKGNDASFQHASRPTFGPKNSFEHACWVEKYQKPVLGVRPVDLDSG
jgi:hypothetical protein